MENAKWCSGSLSHFGYCVFLFFVFCVCVFCVILVGLCDFYLMVFDSGWLIGFVPGSPILGFLMGLCGICVLFFGNVRDCYGVCF